MLNTRRRVKGFQMVSIGNFDTILDIRAKCSEWSNRRRGLRQLWIAYTLPVNRSHQKPTSR